MHSGKQKLNFAGFPTFARADATCAAAWTTAVLRQLLPETTALGALDLEMTLGYFVPTEEDIIKVKFLKEFEGYQ